MSLRKGEAELKYREFIMINKTCTASEAETDQNNVVKMSFEHANNINHKVQADNNVVFIV